MQDWQKVYTTRIFSEASIIQGMLEENNIPVQILNKQDSSYPMFGDIQLYVPHEFSLTARELINNTLLN